jgi:hypothetical protein
MKLSKMQPGGEKYREIVWMRQAGVWLTPAILFEVGAGFIPALEPARIVLRAGINPAPTSNVDLPLNICIV